MFAWQWNGRQFEPCSGVPLSDRGFRYGMALFASVRVHRGEAEFFEAHLARLMEGCASRGLPLQEEALHAGAALLRDGKLSGFARFYVTAGDGAPAAQCSASRLFLFIEERTPPSPEDAWALAIHDETCRPLFGGLKTANYWFNAEALAHAQGRQCNEALLFNDFGELVSACMANVFLVHGEELSTPARSSGCRRGVVRDWVLGRRKAGERRLKREDVLSADEIFLTNSWIGVMPVATLEGRPLGPRRIGPKLAAELAARRA